MNDTARHHADVSGLSDLQASEAPRRNPLTILWQRRWIIATCGMLGLLLAIFLIVRTTPLYQSAATIYIETSGPKVTQTDATGFMGGQTTFLQTQSALIRTNTILSRVAKDPRIAQLPSFRDRPEAVVGFLFQRLSVNTSRLNDFVSIAVKTEEPGDGPVLVDAVVRAYQDFVNLRREESQGGIASSLQRSRRELEKSLGEKQREMLEFQRRNASYQLGTRELNPIIQRMSVLSQQLTQAELDELNSSTELAETRAMMDDNAKIQQLLASQALRAETASIRQEMRSIQQALIQSSRTLMQGSAVIAGLREQLKLLEEDYAAQSRAAIEAYVFSLEQRVKRSQAVKDQLQRAVNQQQSIVTGLNVAQAEFDSRRAELLQLERAIDVVDSRLKELDLARDYMTSAVASVTVVNKPEAGITPVEPDKMSITYQCLLGGLMLGVALAFLRDYTDQRMRSVDEVKTVVGLPVLGVVPRIVTGTTAGARGQALHTDPMSDVAEAYRTIRTAVYFGTPAGGPRTILLTSPVPGDGKSTLAANLAIAMAQAGNRVLLLDADFRKPTQHKIFELSTRVGLSNLLAGDISLSQAIQSTQVAGLDVLPCGPIPANPSEILNSQTFADLLDELKEQYDHVLLDSPPVMPVTDARILAASCDATILCLRAEKSTRKAAVMARDTLRSVGASMLGIVVNDVPRRKGLYGYYYSYGDTYQYGYGQPSHSGDPKPPAPAREPAATK